MSEHLKPILEALVFASPEPLTLKEAMALLEGEALYRACGRAQTAPGGTIGLRKNQGDLVPRGGERRQSSFSELGRAGEG